MRKGELWEGIGGGDGDLRDGRFFDGFRNWF